MAVYSFPMNTESDTHGFRKVNVFIDKFSSCPVIAGLYPELEPLLNIHITAMIIARDGKLS